MKMKAKNIYDHRLKDYVRKTGDLQTAINQGVPRSTAYRWLRSATQPVVSLEYFNYSKEEFEFEVLKLKKQIEILRSILKIIILALRASDFSFTHKQIQASKKRTKLIHAIDEARELIPIRKLLKVINISAARFHSWKSKEIGCDYDNTETCPGTTPNKLTTEEVHEIRKMATSDEYRHVSTGTLSLLAQRLGRVFASPSTWYRLIKERGWRRPRTRIHPSKPRLGIRALLWVRAFRTKSVEFSTNILKC